MTIFDMPNYMTYTLLGMVVLTLIYNLALNKWIMPAVITFVILGVVAFLIPNFQHISYEPLLGYAAFLGVLSLIISFLTWFSTRKWRKKRREKKRRKELRKQGGVPREDIEQYRQFNNESDNIERISRDKPLSRFKRHK
ncbi:hypothetical protein [Staphylococcus marylandisciuri]|uniref:hypothetical protein n=1 Tax=Staphylococcus marylandisciuri TaxID=2981529 RepID=UPI003571799F